MPTEVALNPGPSDLYSGTESLELEQRLAASHIPYSHACTPVLLRADQLFDDT